MYQYRISKYNPLYRDNSGRYLLEDWTSFTDVGQVFDNKTLTLDLYIEVENSYIETVRLFLQESNIQAVTIVDCEGTDSRIPVVHSGEEVSIQTLEIIIPFVLREKVWYKFEFNGGYLHFGYDYYMYIACPIEPEESIKIVEEKGLYVEKMVSPYIDLPSY